jgi:superfamily II DNA/RNA helicase
VGEKVEIASKPYLSLLEVFTKMNNVAGLGSSGSQRAMDMRMKIQYINEKNQGRGVIMATGTPLSNSMVELYVMQLYLQERRLHEKGIYHFDAWASVFGEVTSSLELAPEGTGYRMRTRFNKFINLPELIHLFKEVADIILPDMLDIKRPELKDGKYKVVVSEASDYVKERMQEMVERAEAIHRGVVDPKDDNMLRITGEARLLGTDPRLLDSYAPVDSDSKLNKAVENIYQEYVQSQEQKGTQIVFSDIGTPGPGKAFTVYDYLKQELITRGVPEEEICFIHDAKTDEQRDRMFSDVRAGRKRIIIGSTEKLGVGTNIQTRMVAAHHIDCPWKPSDIEQREGRIIRQGNENEEVNIYRYVTKGSFDAYLWGIVETKQRFISQVFTSRKLARICEDIDETVLNFAEIKAVASENPLIMEKIQVDNEVARLRILKTAHEGKRFALQDAVTFQYPKRIQSLEKELQSLQKDLDRRNQAMEVQPEFAITLQGKVYEKHKEAGEVLRGIIEGVTAFTRHEVGMYKGFQVFVQKDMMGPVLFLQGEKEYSVELKSSDSGNMVRMENRLNVLDKAVEDVQKEITTCENEIKNAKQEYEKPFPYEELLKENITRQMEIDAELEIKDQEECVEVQEETKNLPCQTAVR